MARIVGGALALVAVAAFASSAGAATPEEILAQRPLPPTDVGLFVPEVYPGSPPLQPAAGAEPTQAEASAMLDSYLAVEWPGNVAAQDAARAVFADSRAVAKVPSPSLRAALSALRGTFADAAIDYIVSGTVPGSTRPAVESVSFGPTTNNNIAQVNGGSNPDQTRIVFEADQRATNPFEFTRLFAHEAVHQDAQDPTAEEEVAVALDTLFYLDQISRHPELARSGSEVARRNNANALLRLNSGTGATLGLYATNGGAPVFPGGAVAYKSFHERFTPQDGATSPGNGVLGAYLTALGAPSCPVEFSKALLDCIDARGNAHMNAQALVGAADALRLDTGSAAPDQAACDRARKKLAKAKAKLKKLRENDAPKAKIKKAKAKVRKAKKAVRDAC